MSNIVLKRNATDTERRTPNDNKAIHNKIKVALQQHDCDLKGCRVGKTMHMPSTRERKRERERDKKIDLIENDFNIDFSFITNFLSINLNL